VPVCHAWSNISLTRSAKRLQADEIARELTARERFQSGWKRSKSRPMRAGKRPLFEVGGKSLRVPICTSLMLGTFVDFRHDGDGGRHSD
jgi:hypothetical protein